jgi:protein AATF/BFR2
VEVGKSKLRKSKSSALGPQYRGSKVDRDALMEDDEDDPFGRGFEDEDSEEENDATREDGASGEDVDNTGDETPDTDISDEEMDAPRPHLNGAATAEDRATLLKAVAKSQRDVASSLAQSTKAEAEKGSAVKKQKAAFDSLLNTRIKLQKSLVGANTIVGLPSDELEVQRSGAKDSVEAAELAAFRLWSSLNDMREELIAARTGEKRKRGTFSEMTPTEDLWSHVQAQEENALIHRKAILNRWSRKTREATARPEGGVINRTTNQPTIIDALQETLSNRERLLKRAHTPRSCAPLQLEKKVISDPKIYDDADFYGLLLKELLERKSADSVAASHIDLNFSLRKEAKTKKNVDTKASKGRKLRYTVHEKLQNFMAPEDRSSWSERQADELFGSLFGRGMGLGEGRNDDDEEEMVDGAEAEEAGLMLFRT